MKINKSISNTLLLLIGAIAITFSGINWHIGITAWIGPIFLLMFTRNTKWYKFVFFFIVISISGAISQTSNNLMNLPEVNVFNGISFGIGYSISFIIDKLLYKKDGKFYYSLVFPASVTFIEFLVSQAIGTWGSIAHTQFEFKPLMQLSSLTGIFGIWFMVAWFASIINWMVEHKNKRSAIYKGAIIYGSALLLILLYGALRITSNNPNEEKVKVATVLSDNNIHQIVANEANTFKELATGYNLKVPDKLFSDSLIINTLIKRTTKALMQGAKIIVWNEIALIVNQKQKQDIISKIKLICNRDNAYVLLSFLEECTDKNKKPFNNVCILISPQGEMVWEYQKSFLHPTAEAPIVNNGNFNLPITQTEYGKIGSVICADLDITKFIKQAGKKSVDILLVPAFDWAEITPLHSQMACLQAIQFGFSLVRSNGMGVSVACNYKGNEIASLNTLTSDTKIMYADIPIKSNKTSYSCIGDIFAYLTIFFLVFMVIMKIVIRKD